MDEVLEEAAQHCVQIDFSIFTGEKFEESYVHLGAQLNCIGLKQAKWFGKMMNKLLQMNNEDIVFKFGDVKH